MGDAEALTSVTSVCRAACEAVARGYAQWSEADLDDATRLALLTLDPATEAM